MTIDEFIGSVDMALPFHKIMDMFGDHFDTKPSGFGVIIGKPEGGRIPRDVDGVIMGDLPNWMALKVFDAWTRHQAVHS